MLRGFAKTGVTADSHAEALSGDQLVGAYPVAQLEGHARDGDRVIGAWLGDTGDRHVAIADRLDLLHAVARGDRVDVGEDLVETAD